MKKRFPYYPIYIDIEDRNVLIVGGGTVCARKAETMMRYGGRVTIVESGDHRRDRSVGARRSAGRSSQDVRRSGPRRRLDRHRVDGRSVRQRARGARLPAPQDPGECRRRHAPLRVHRAGHHREGIDPDRHLDRRQIAGAGANAEGRPAADRSARSTPRSMTSSARCGSRRRACCRPTSTASVSSTASSPRACSTCCATDGGARRSRPSRARAKPTAWRSRDALREALEAS